MRTEQITNRVAAELHQWQGKEQRLGQLFSFDVTSDRAFLKEKLKYYNAITARYKDSVNAEEKLALRMLQRESSRIEKQLYPNLLVRLLRKLTVEPLQQKYLARQEVKQRLQNQQALKNALHKAGFGQVANQLEQHLRKGLNEFTIPVSQYMSEKQQMNYQLSFAKDASGQYGFKQYIATLNSNHDPAQNKHQLFRKEEGITAEQAYNLLAGRAIGTEQTALDGSKQTGWLQLDFTDKDALGNHRMKEFHASYGDTLKQVLNQLPLEQKLDEQGIEKLLTDLRNGNRPMVFLQKDGLEQKYFIEANPGRNSVTLYDYRMKKVSINSVLEQKATHQKPHIAQTTDIRQLHPGKGRRNGISVG